MPASDSTRTPVSSEPALSRALRLKVSKTGRSLMDDVDEAVRALLAGDAVDLAALKAGAREQTVSYESFAERMSRAPTTGQSENTVRLGPDPKARRLVV